MNSNERAALVDELAEAIYTEYAMRDADRIPFMPWDAEAGPRMNKVRQEFRRQAYAIMPIIDRLLDAADTPRPELVRLRAQVRYLKSSLISAEMRAENVKGRGPEVVARIERIIGGIEGNMEVAAVEALRNAMATQEAE